MSIVKRAAALGVAAAIALALSGCMKDDGGPAGPYDRLGVVLRQGYRAGCGAAGRNADEDCAWGACGNGEGCGGQGKYPFHDVGC